MKGDHVVCLKVKKTMSSKRSYEVTVAGAIILGMGLFLSLYFLTAYFSLKQAFSLQTNPAPFPYARFVISIIMTAGFTILGIFILRLRDWARVFSLVLMICWMVMGLTQVREAYAVGFASAAWCDCLIVFLVPAIACIYLLTLPKVIEQFNSNRRCSGDRMEKVIALTVGSILLVLYLSAPFGVWDGNSKIGRIVTKIRTFFISWTNNEQKKPEAIAPSQVNETAVIAELPIHQVELAEKSNVPHEFPTQEAKIASGASKANLAAQALSVSQLSQDTKS
jgi:hypothetical protein